MPKVNARKKIDKSLIEFKSLEGSSGRQYLLVKGKVRKTDFFNAFVATELKGTMLDILGRPDTPENRKTNSNALADEVWYGKKAKASAGK